MLVILSIVFIIIFLVLTNRSRYDDLGYPFIFLVWVVILLITVL